MRIKRETITVTIHGHGESELTIKHIINYRKKNKKKSCTYLNTTLKYKFGHF